MGPPMVSVDEILTCVSLSLLVIFRVRVVDVLALPAHGAISMIRAVVPMKECYN